MVYTIEIYKLIQKLGHCRHILFRILRRWMEGSRFSLQVDLRNSQIRLLLRIKTL